MITLPSNIAETANQSGFDRVAWHPISSGPCCWRTRTVSTKTISCPNTARHAAAIATSIRLQLGLNRRAPARTYAARFHPIDTGLMERSVTSGLESTSWIVALAMVRAPSWMPYPGIYRTHREGMKNLGETAENPSGLSNYLIIVDGCQNPRKDGAAKKGGMALAFISAAPCSRTLGGKRWLGDKPCQGRQPPEAGAPSRPREFHPESLTEPYLTLSRHTARAIARKPAGFPLHC